MQTIQQLAADSLDFLQTKTRTDGTEFICQSDDAPEWFKTLCQDAHGDFLPDDWRYEFISDSLRALSDFDDQDEAMESATEASIYTHELLQWLASNLTRPTYCDDAISELGEFKDTVQLISAGQYMERSEVFQSVLASLESQIGE
jgi:hypothetical protein